MITDVRVTWNKALEELQAITENSVGYNVHVKTAVPIRDNGNIFTIAVPISISKTMIDFRYKDFLEASLERATGRVLTLEVIVDDDPKALQEKTIYKSEKADDPTLIGANSVNENYTFENFVIGSSNEIATMSAMRIADNPGYVSNPFFLYGKSGVGKTHLMHAIGNRIRENNPDLNIIYVTSESFTSEFVNAIRYEKTMEFKNKYRSADVLLIDDVQFIERTEATQEEFFHTFNALYTLNKQIVITSDRKPNDLVTLEERLRTRFAQGLTMDLSVPDYETRLAILKKKAELHKTHIDEEVLSHIADRIKSNIRELEGALLKIISMSQISNDKITIEYAEDVIKSLLPDEGIIKITPDKIMDKVSSFYNISKADLKGQSKLKQFAFPRQVAMYLCSKLTELNYTMIGNIFGGKHRSTVDYNVNTIEKEMKSNESLTADINYIIHDLESL